MPEAIQIRSAVAMVDGEIILLDLTTADGQLFTFRLEHADVTLESLRNALDRVGQWKDGAKPGHPPRVITELPR